jgi:diguanylate cyclase (GGDEF)-like protein/PAS domain S-box-containing protein/putative nucleotidyltransferase with HDIG domain
VPEKNEYVLDILSQDFLDQIPLVLIGFNQSGKILFWNDKATYVTGYDKKEALERGLPFFLKMILTGGGGVISPDEKFLAAAFTGEQKLQDIETSVLTRNGQVRYIRWNSYVVMGKEKRSAVVITGNDVTARYNLEKDLQAKDTYIKSATNRLKKFVSLDPHTGIFNYRYFISRLNDCFYKSVELSEPMSLIVIGVDYFCSINNIHGVSNGDRILRNLARLIKESVDKTAIVARLGGAEFAVLMPGTDTKRAFDLSGQIFTGISDHDFGFSKLKVAVNLSLHMAIGGLPLCGDAHTPEQLLDIVTDKLREAKNNGDSSVLICGSSGRAPDPSGQSDEDIDVHSEEYRYTVEFVNALANTVKMKDLYTNEHSASMSNYAVYMAEGLGLSHSQIRDIKLGSLLHDIGKIGIDKMILLKPGSLTQGEYDIIKQHPRIGAEIIRSVHPLKKVVPLVLYHHERYDGKGYPSGLMCEEIPLGARIVSLADVFQAVTSDRPYRRALPEKEALEIIKDGSGKAFDPKIVKVFLEVYKPSD